MCDNEKGGKNTMGTKCKTWKAKGHLRKNSEALSVGLSQELPMEYHKKKSYTNPEIILRKCSAPQQANASFMNSLYFALLKLRRFQEFLNLAKMPSGKDFFGLLTFISNKLNTENGYNAENLFLKGVMSDISKSAPLSSSFGCKEVSTFYSALIFGFFHFEYVDKKLINKFFL